MADQHAAPSATTLRTSLCLLTWNEIAGCRNDVGRLPLDQFDEVYAVDAGSTDGTVEYLEGQCIRVHRQPRRGYNQAYLLAFERCSTDALVLYHPKGSIDPVDVLKARQLLIDGYDLVIASRMIAGAVNDEDSKLLRPRKWFVLMLAVIANLFWRRQGPLIWDVLHGFRGMRRDRFFALPPLDHGLSIDLEMVVRSYRRRFNIVEFPIVERPRLDGSTHFKAFRTGRQLLLYLLKELRRPA